MSNAGLFNRRLTLEAPMEIPDGAGGVARSHESVATLWASVVPVSAREEVEAAQRGVTLTHRIVLRYSADITSRHRFRDGARIFRIVALHDRDGRKRFLDVQAEERSD